jgi:hypothetical protein
LTRFSSSSLLRPADTEVKFCLGNKKIPQTHAKPVSMRLLCPALDTTVFGTLRAMDKAKKSNPTFKKPDLAAMRQAVASSTAIETGQSIHVLEQKPKDPSKRRFADIKLAD